MTTIMLALATNIFTKLNKNPYQVTDSLLQLAPIHRSYEQSTMKGAKK